jgi:hypothetical protein
MLSRTKKIILGVSIVLAASAGIGIYHHRKAVPQDNIYDFNPTRDTQPIMDIFNKNWYWLLAHQSFTRK